MKIYTKTGDSGTTSLVGGTRVSKTHPRVMAYGDLDELISHLGVLRGRCREMAENAPENGGELMRTEGFLRRIQEDLMQISAHFAADTRQAKLKSLDGDMDSGLEQEIDRLTALLPPLNSFVLPASPVAASECHIARTVCRRAERSAFLIEDLPAEDEPGRRYLNRLSDYLFTLARYLCIAAGGSEDFWIP